MGAVPVFASADEALEMVRAGLGYLAAADAGQLGAAAQARCLKVFEQADAIATAARASFLAAFTAGQGYADDAAYGARAWLIHQTHVTAGAAVGHTAWARRSGTHPRVLAALAAGRISESVGRQICLWTDKLPEDRRDTSDRFLLDAATGGLGLEELAALAGQLYERSRSERPDEDPRRRVQGPGRQAGHHVRRGRGPARRPDRRVRGDRGRGAGRAGRQGREGRQPVPAGAVSRRAGRGDALSSILLALRSCRSSSVCRSHE